MIGPLASKDIASPPVTLEAGRGEAPSDEPDTKNDEILALRLARRLSRACNYGALIVLLAVLGHMTLEIVLRSFFSTSTYVVEEFVGYGLATITFLSLAETMMQGAFIRFDLLLSNLAERNRRLVEILAVALALLLTVFMSYYLIRLLVRDWSRNVSSTTVAEVPLWIPEAIMVFGLFVFVLQLLSYLLSLVFGGALIKQSHVLE
jgi:TRAP-type C4-dicarboxylate transport system permease small subunit